MAKERKRTQHFSKFFDKCPPSTLRESGGAIELSLLTIRSSKKKKKFTYNKDSIG
jgi:D-serine dehydratase